MNLNRNNPFEERRNRSISNENERKKESNENYTDSFMKDWQNCRERHEGQKRIIQAYLDGAQYIIAKAGRKFAKTTSAIDIAWHFANEKPNRVIYFCYPTIAMGIEVLWEEKRLQRCDLYDDRMKDKYVEKTDDSRHIISFNNGSFMKLIGTWSEARGRGTQPDLLVVDELQDCSASYLDAMDPNLAAKDGKCFMCGTPPKKRNHFYEWWDRIGNNPRGKQFHFTSYDNTSLPHLKEWLDRKKEELYKASKHDEWIREYLAEDCFSSADRVLPDVEFKENLDEFLRSFDPKERIPVLAVSMQGKYFCAVLAIVVRRKAIFILEGENFSQIWNTSFSEIYEKLGNRMKEIQDLCPVKLRHVVWDPTQSLGDVINRFSKCRKDIKWQERGIPLLREMILGKKIFFSSKISDFGLECQNLLRDESEKEIEKGYPFVSALSMLVNEYFSMERSSQEDLKEFDKYQGFREMGIPCPRKKKPKSIFKMGF